VKLAPKLFVIVALVGIVSMGAALSAWSQSLSRDERIEKMKEFIEDVEYDRILLVDEECELIDPIRWRPYVAVGAYSRATVIFANMSGKVVHFMFYSNEFVTAGDTITLNPGEIFRTHFRSNFPAGESRFDIICVDQELGLEFLSSSIFVSKGPRPQM